MQARTNCLRELLGRHQAGCWRERLKQLHNPQASDGKDADGGRDGCGGQRRDMEGRELGWRQDELRCGRSRPAGGDAEKWLTTQLLNACELARREPW